MKNKNNFMFNRFKKIKNKKSPKGLIALTFSAIFGIISVVAYFVFRKHKKPEAMELEEYYKDSKKEWSPKRIALWSFIVVLLMIVVSSLSMDQFFMTSILSAQQKERIVKEAKIRLDKDYGYGQMGPDAFDCSGLVSVVIKEALGVNLPRSSRDQYSVGREIAFDNLGVGDLVFFDTAGGGYISHVGVITRIEGDKKYMTNANSYLGKTIEEELKGYWLQTYVGAREITAITYDDIAPTIPDETYEIPVGTVNENYPTGVPPSEEVAVLEVDEGIEGNEADEVEAVVVEEVSTEVIDEIDNEIVEEIVMESEKTDQLFIDVSIDSMNYKAINYLKKQGVIGGYEDGSFRPENNITRAELLKIIFEGKKIDTSLHKDVSTKFIDVADDHPLKQYISAAKTLGIVGGYEDGSFKPNKIVTRGEAAKMILNLENVALLSPSVNPYTDVSADIDLAPYVSYVKNKNLLQIDSDVYGLNLGMSRGETAEFIYRLTVLRHTGLTMFSEPIF